MKAAIKTKREPGIEVGEMEEPVAGDDGLLVRVLAGSLCGSDVHIYEWTAGYEWLPVPIVLGHEFAGEVVEAGARVQGVRPGDRITAFPAMRCSSCAACRVGRGEDCHNRRALGLTANGVFAEYVRLTAGAALFPIPEGLSEEAASLCEPLSVALRAVELAGIRPGQTVGILGPGPIGLLTLQLARAAGAGLLMMAGTAADGVRLEIAGRLGADVIVDVEREDPVERARQETGGRSRGGLDMVFEATGFPGSVQQGLSMVRPEGKVILIGIHSGPAQFDATALVRLSKSIIGAYGYDADIWRRSLSLLSSKKVSAEEVITHRIPLSEARDGFELASRKQAAKVLFIP